MDHPHCTARRRNEAPRLRARKDDARTKDGFRFELRPAPGAGAARLGHHRYCYAHASASDGNSLAIAAQPTGRAGPTAARRSAATSRGAWATTATARRWPRWSSWGGRLVAGTQRREPLPEGAERRPDHVAELVDLAQAGAQARRELAASRPRLVEAADAERRRLERDLHDAPSSAWWRCR
jgi:signal transduction histidine kinase